MISAASFRNRAFATDCRHCCLIVVGYWRVNVAEYVNNVWSRGRYKVDWYWFLYACICSSISLISLCFHGCWSWWRMVFLCSHYFQHTSQIATMAFNIQRVDDLFHFVDVITICSCCASIHFELRRPIRKLRQFIESCSLIARCVVSPKLNWLNGKRLLSYHPKILDFHTVIIAGFVRRVTNVSSNSFIAFSHYVRAESAGHCNTCKHVSLSFKHRGHKSWHSRRRFNTLPTGTNQSIILFATLFFPTATVDWPLLSLTTLYCVRAPPKMVGDLPANTALILFYHRYNRITLLC